ncbi:MAG: Bacterial Ig-like domain (group 1) [Candidatus Cloacimonetes bacterium ADurb.Bin211]|nr:MAG: Bacterial Ig-like domain (group 1) [Candidatus Cloacimonetes bacterium ADurb.Bin211]
MRKINNLFPIVIFLVLALFLVITSCDRRNPPPTGIGVVKPSEVVKITKIIADPDTIYCDNNITFSQISVTVKDGDGFAIPDKIVNFRANIGRILRSVPTDSSGVATTTFWDDGEQGLATIMAVVQNISETTNTVISADTARVEVFIDEIPPVESITLNFSSQDDPYPMTVLQTTEIDATAKNILGQTVPNNTLITFSCNKGKFVDEGGNTLGTNIVSKTINGKAYARYNAGTKATTTPGEEPAYVTASIGDISSTREVIIYPANPFNIRLQSFVQVGEVMVETDTSSVASPNNIYMLATLKDPHGNPCPTIPVRFETNLGSFMNTTQSITLNTNTMGEAQVRFTPGLAAGAATIKAFANNDTLQTQIIFNIKSDDIYSISFTQQEQITLNVANTGGTDSAILRVKLKDINGNLIDYSQEVYFRIVNLNPPAGANLNNHPVTDSVLVISTGGEAQVSVNSGSESGILIIRASCIAKDGRWIHATKANIVIHAGPPAEVKPFIGGFNTGQNMGGGLWRVVAGAVVKDRYGNPVETGTSVFFELVYNVVTNCQIGAAGYVGNTSVEDDSLAGVAYTTVTYSGNFTYDWIVIRASTGAVEGEGVAGYATVQLPLNDPQFEARMVPGHLNFFSNDTWLSADFYAVLTDGQGKPVGNAVIICVSTKGQFVPIPGFNNNYPFDPPWQIITDDGDYGMGDKAGWAWGQIKFHKLEVPAGDPITQMPGQTTGDITLNILGTNVSYVTSIILYRYWDGCPPF